MKYEPIFGNQKGFKEFHKKIEYCKAIVNLKTRNYQQVLKSMNHLGFSILQFKIILKMILPESIIQQLNSIVFLGTGHKAIRTINENNQKKRFP